MTRNILFSRTQLERKLDNIIEYHGLSPVQKLQLDWLTNTYPNTLDLSESYSEFIKNMVYWFFYLKIYLNKEDYLIAAKLRDVIYFEQHEFLEFLVERFEADAQIEESYVRKINAELKKIFRI